MNFSYDYSSTNFYSKTNKNQDNAKLYSSIMLKWFKQGLYSSDLMHLHSTDHENIQR